MDTQNFMRWALKLCNEQYSGNLKELTNEIRDFEGR